MASKDLLYLHHAGCSTVSPDHRKVRTGDALDGMSFFVEMVEPFSLFGFDFSRNPKRYQIVVG